MAINNRILCVDCGKPISGRSAKSCRSCTRQLYHQDASFWNHIAVSSDESCWIWKGPRNQKGYGWAGKLGRSHRIAWIITHGKIPDKLCVLHKCDNRMCCNPNHLFLGTRADNNADRHAKGRSRGGWQAGEKNSGAKLTAKQVLWIREQSEKGMPALQIAKILGIKRSYYITRIIKGGRWKNLMIQATPYSYVRSDDYRLKQSEIMRQVWARRKAGELLPQRK